MANNKLKETESLTKAVEKLNKTLSNTDRVNNKIFNNYEKKIKKSTRHTDSLTESFKTFRKVMEGTSTKGLATSLDELPKYIKGVTKMTSSFSSYTKEVGKTKDMFNTMGISFNKTMKDLENRSSSVSKSMNMLVSRANKLASAKDALLAVPKQLKEIQDSMKKTPEIKLGSMKKLTSMVEGLKTKVSAVDFKDIQGKIEKIGKGDGAEGLVKNIQEKLSKLKVEPLIIGGEAAAKKAVSNVSAELNKLSDLSPGDELINTFLGNLQELSKDDTFSKITGKYKEDINSFEKLLAKPGVTYAEVTDSMVKLNDKLSESMSSYFDNFDKKASFFEKKMIDLKKHQEELSDKFREGYKLTFFTDEAISQFQGALTQMASEAYSLQANNIIPDEQIIKSKEMLAGLRKLTELNEENAKIQSEIAADESDRKDTLENLLKDQRKNEKAIKSQVKHMKNLEKLSFDYAKHVGDAAESGLGQKKADELSNKLFGLSGTLKRLGTDMGPDSKIGKGLAGLGKSAGRFGVKLRALSFPIAVITAAISLGKVLLNLESKYASLSQEAVSTGALMGKSSAEVGASIDALNIKATNLAGLYAAASGKREFALSRKEIMGVVSSLDEAGLAARNIEKQMKGVKTTAAAAGNEFLGAANIVTIFSHNLGISKGAVANLMGEMAYEFNSTMGSLKDSFRDITASVKESGMSTNRFLATVQTATAGLSFYEDQVKSTAQMVAHLGKNTNLTGADISKVAKTVSEFANDTDKAIKAFAMVKADPNALKDMASMAKDSIEAITVKMSKTTDPKELANLKAQKENTVLMQKALETGEIGEAGTLMKYMGADLQASLLGGVDQFVTKATEGMGKMEQEKMAERAGIGEMRKLATARGMSLEKYLKEISKTTGDSTEQDNKAFNIDKKVGDSRNKLIESIQTRLTLGFGAVVPILLGILAAVSGGALMSGFSKFFKGGGPGGGKGSETILGKAKGLFSKGTPGLIDAAGTSLKKPGMIGQALGKTKEMAGAATGFISKKAAPAMGVLGKAGGALKGAGKLLKLGRAIPILGTLVGAGFVANDIMGIMKKMITGEGVTSGDVAKLGMNALSMVPVVGIPAIGADIAMEATGGYDALSKATAGIGKPKLNASNTIDPSGITGREIPKPGDRLVGNAGIVNNLTKRQSTTLASTSSTKNINNTNNFHINGDNPGEMKKIILDTLIQYERQTS